MSKQKWIEEVLQSAKHRQAAEVSPFLPLRVQAKLDRLREDTVRMPVRWALTLAAMITALLVLNISAWRNLPHPHKNSGLQQVMQENGWGQSESDVYFMNFSK